MRVSRIYFGSLSFFVSWVPTSSLIRFFFVTSQSDHTLIAKVLYNFHYDSIHHPSR